MTEHKPFKIKLHPLMDEKTLNAISDATLEAIDDQLYKPPQPDDIGKSIKGEGIYLGTYAPVDRDGISLKKVFNVFAAPEDLPKIMTYSDTVKYIENLKDWHGHDGTDYATDKEIYAALKDGSYTGGWIIPTRDVLHGKDVDGNPTTPDNILKLARNDNNFKDTFNMSGASNGYYPGWYWSSTVSPNDRGFSWTFCFSRGGAECFPRNTIGNLSCRPVRLVPV